MALKASKCLSPTKKSRKILLLETGARYNRPHLNHSKMRKSSIVLPEHVLNKMSPEDRKPLGNAGRTQKEIAQVQYVKSERAIHDQFTSFLRRHARPYVHSDPTKRSSIVAGHPDFLIPPPRSLYVEFKVFPNTLSSIQTDYINFLVANNQAEVHVITEMPDHPGNALQQACDIVSEYFNF